MKKSIKITIFILLISIIGIVLFIKFNTGAAAQFTDNYLRPILGHQIVGFLEKTYFNAADKVQQLTDKTGSSDIPQFNDTGFGSTATPIPSISGLASVKGEGIWHNWPLKQFPGQEVVSYAFVRPDNTRPFAYVTFAEMNMKFFNLGIVAGKEQPGGPLGNSGPGLIPQDIVVNGNLVAAFNGGFQFRDGGYGMVVGDKTYVPLIKDTGTLIGYKDGSLKIVNYKGQDLGKDIVFIRQNCPILVENGNTFISDENNKHIWGRTFNADIYTWRSGLGLTANGNLIYAVGNNLSPLSLSTALKMAGAVNAIQLDVNPFWVRFNIFEPKDTGGYTTKTLTKDLKDGSVGYLKGYAKDFFYIYKK